MLNFQAINSNISSLGMCNKENINDLFTKSGSAVVGLEVWEGCYCRIAPGSFLMILFCIPIVVVFLQPHPCVRIHRTVHQKSPLYCMIIKKKYEAKHKMLMEKSKDLFSIQEANNEAQYTKTVLESHGSKVPETV